MKGRTLIALGGLAAAIAAGLWWALRGAASSSGTTGATAPLNLGGALDLGTSGQQLTGGSLMTTLDNTLGSLTPSLGASGRGPLGIRDNNPGNLRYISDPARAWNGQVGDNQGFGVYSSPALGVRAMSKQLQEDYANGDYTLADLITTWAPPSENNTAAYISAVASQTGLDPHAPLELQSNLPAIVAAIIQHENGEQPYPMSEINTWVYMA